MSIPYLSASDIVRQVKSGELSALEVTEALLAHIAAVDGIPGRLDGPSEAPGVHAFLTVTAERARAQARKVDARIAAGEDPGALAGVPFSAKDIFCVEGTPSTAGSARPASSTPPAAPATSSTSRSRR